jgi:hypothetical protein
MGPVIEDFIAHSYLKGMIDRERLSFQEQKKHYGMNISRWFQMDARASARRNIMPAIHGEAFDTKVPTSNTAVNYSEPPSQFVLHSTLVFGRSNSMPIGDSMGGYNYGYFAAFVGLRQTTLQCLYNGLILNTFGVTLESILIPREVPQLPIQKAIHRYIDCF